MSWIKPQLDEHREKFDPDNIRDFIDTYLSAAKDLADSGDCNTALTGDPLFLMSWLLSAHNNLPITICK